jgi:hypothetical protein
MTDNQVRAENLGCYCTLWDKDPAFLNNNNIPTGYCGLCDKCGKPGHTRHFPGAVPYTGTWCEKHYRQTMIIHPLGRIGIILYFFIIFSGVIAFVLL